MIKVEIREEAEAELADAVAYYEERVSGLGMDFLAVVESLQLLQSAPRRWPEKALGLRQLILPRFPFIIHYRLELDTVVVYAFAHTSRKPYYWHPRTN